MIDQVRIIALASVVAIGSTAALAQSPPRQDKAATAARKAECKKQADAQHFGIHWIKRSRFIDECRKRG